MAQTEALSRYLNCHLDDNGICHSRWLRVGEAEIESSQSVCHGVLMYYTMPGQWWVETLEYYWRPISENRQMQAVCGNHRTPCVRLPFFPFLQYAMSACFLNTNLNFHVIDKNATCFLISFIRIVYVLIRSPYLSNRTSSAYIEYLFEELEWTKTASARQLTDSC